MAKFGSKDPNADDAPAPVERVIPPTPAPPPPQVTVDMSGASATMSQQTVQMNQQTAQAQAAASVGLAETAIDKEVVENQLQKQEEHWMKSYWRPAMGWLYMLICFCDFVGFPIISMFMPVMIKGMPYVAWKSITLDNGGLIHLAFGGILGVTAYGRTQEKITK
jgi:hypothetical protein